MNYVVGGMLRFGGGERSRGGEKKKKKKEGKGRQV